MHRKNIYTYINTTVNNMEKYLNIVIPILLALFAGIGWLYKHEKEKRLQIERQLSEKKYQVYIKFINLYFKLYENTRYKRSMTDQEIFKVMIEIKKELLIYGSDSVVLKFFKWEQFSNEGKNSLVPVTDVIIEMRKDMVSYKTKITTTNFLRSIVKDKKEYDDLRKEGIV